MESIGVADIQTYPDVSKEDRSIIAAGLTCSLVLGYQPNHAIASHYDVETSQGIPHPTPSIDASTSRHGYI